MASDSLRIGIVGAGAIMRQRHIPGLAAIPGVEVTAVANRRSQSAREFAREFGVARVYQHWTQLVHDPDIDVVWIGATPYIHARVSVAALEAGKHVFCQARMARNLAEAREMVAAAALHPQLVAAVCPPPHGMPGDAAMRRLLRVERFAGSVRHVRLTAFTGDFADAAAPLHWRQDAAVSGFNTLTVGIFAEVMHRWVGPAAELQARADTYVRTRTDPASGALTEVGVPDALSVIGKLVSGADFVYQWSGIARHAPATQVWIYGDEGTLVYDFGDDTIRGARAGDADLSEIPIPPGERVSWSVEADFVRALRAGGDTGLAPDFQTAAGYMEFTEAAMRSAREGRRLALPL